MTEQIARNVGPAGIDVAYERLGDAQAPAVLLVMGLGAQLIGWPEGFCAELVARDLQVVRFDNRDVGHSTHWSAVAAPSLAAVLGGDLSAVPYTLSDLAADTVGLLDALDLPGAHLVGASLGGMIAQTVAIEHPDRVRSLTSIMSTTGDRTVGQPSPAALQALAAPPAGTRQDLIERQVRSSRVYRSPGFAPDEAAVADRAGRTYDRGYDPAGVARQMAAIVASGDRTPRLRSLAVPTLVLHGTGDQLCDVSGGRATAAAIPGAELVLVDGWGHDLPMALWQQLADRIAGLVYRAEAAAVSTVVTSGGDPAS